MERNRQPNPALSPTADTRTGARPRNRAAPSPYHPPMDPSHPSMDGRVTTVRVPGWLARILAIAIIAGGVILGVLIFVPLAIMAGVAFLIYLGYLWVKIRIAKARSPNGSLDGRRNVRVINREE